MTAPKTTIKNPNMKRPTFDTHVYIKRLADAVTFGKIAQLAGKEVQTAEAWGRPVESNLNPTGTGKRNPLDLVLRLIAFAHRDDPALAREMAELFPDYVAFLDNSNYKQNACLSELIGASVKESAEAIVMLLNSPDPNWASAHTEIVQAQIALERLDNYVKSEMKVQTLTAVR